MTPEPEKIRALAQQLIEVALKDVNCIRCSQNIGTDPGFVSSSTLNLVVPMVKWDRRGSLCGSCTMDLVSFLFPDLEHSTDMFEIRKKIADRAAEQGGTAPSWHPER